jgi:hypothetical protein
MPSAATAPDKQTVDSVAQTVGQHNISYAIFKDAVLTLHEQGKEGAEEGDFHVLSRGIHLLNELGAIFPAYAARLADDPEFLS